MEVYCIGNNTKLIKCCNILYLVFIPYDFVVLLNWRSTTIFIQYKFAEKAMTEKLLSRVRVRASLRLLRVKLEYLERPNIVLSRSFSQKQYRRARARARVHEVGRRAWGALAAADAATTWRRGRCGEVRWWMTTTAAWRSLEQTLTHIAGRFTPCIKID